MGIETEVFYVILQNYPYHAVFWTLYYVLNCFNSIKPGKNLEKDVPCQLFLMSRNDIRAYFPMMNASTCQDGFYVDKDIFGYAYMRFSGNICFIQKEWISRLYGTSHGWFLRSMPFCCRLNVIEKDEPSILTKQSLLLHDNLEVTDDLFHLGISDQHQNKNYVVTYTDCHQLLKWKVILGFVQDNNFGRFKTYSLLKNSLLTALENKHVCEITSHCLLCKHCVDKRNTLLEFITDIGFWWNPNREVTPVESYDKVTSVDYNAFFDKVNCDMVKEFFDEPSKFIDPEVYLYLG